MPFSSGTFSLVSGNPVVTGTTISSTWANNTLSDIASNGLSLCVLLDGTQTPTAAIPFYAGTVALPGMTFLSDLDSGMYRIGANNIGLTVNGVKQVDVGTSSFGLTQACSILTGTATPAGGVAGINLGSANIAILWGSGAPTATPARGSLYIRTDNGTNTALYVAKDASGTWAAVTSA